MWLIASLLLTNLLSHVEGKAHVHDSDDLQSYKSRPDLKPPKFWVKDHANDTAQQIGSGYYFVAPYAHSQIRGKGIWSACQQGPAIYDQDGELVWSGACEFGTSHDFRIADCADGPGACLSFTTPGLKWPDGKVRGSGVVMNKHYQIINRVDFVHYDLHEFNVLPGGKSALHCRNRPARMSFRDMGPEFTMDEMVTWTTVNEVNLNDGSLEFKWDVPEHLPLSHSSVKIPEKPGFYLNHPWDYNHLNAIDKNDNGDYLTSFRHCDCIVKISGKTGKILWQLGGKGGDFEVPTEVEFSRQHDVRFIESHKDYTIMSFLDNADAKFGKQHQKQKPSYPYSRGLVVKANHPGGRPTNAVLVRHYDRPDHRFTLARGSFQTLTNKNVLMGWSLGGYMSEHLENGTLLQTSGFNGRRYDTYRSYKHDFIGLPAEPPIFVAEAYGATAQTMTTAFWVTWNGATEVKTWNFYSTPDVKVNSTFLGNTTKDGFETMWMYNGFAENVWVEGVDREGRTLGNSTIQKVTVPADWHKAGYVDKGEPGQDHPSTSHKSHSHGWSQSFHKNVRLESADLSVVTLISIPLLALVLWFNRRRVRLCFGAALERVNSRAIYQPVANDDEEKAAP